MYKPNMTVTYYAYRKTLETIWNDMQEGLLEKWECHNKLEDLGIDISCSETYCDITMEEASELSIRLAETWPKVDAWYEKAQSRQAAR